MVDQLRCLESSRQTARKPWMERVGMEFSLRPLAVKDEPALRALEARCPQGNQIRLVSRIKDLEGYCKAFLEGQILVAHHNSRVVGCVYVARKAPCQHRETATAWGLIHGLRVCPSVRRRGLAGMLLQEAEAWLRERWVFRAYCTVLRDNRATQRLFRHHKYDVLHDIDVRGCPVWLPRRAVSTLPLPRLLSVVETEAFWEQRFGQHPGRPALWRSLLEASGYRGTWSLRRASSEASLSIWNSQAMRSWVPVSMSPWIKASLQTWNAVASVSGGPFIPVQGEEIAYHSWFAPFCSGPRGPALLRQLTEHLSFVSKRQGALLALSRVESRDPCRKHLPRYPVISESIQWLAKPLAPHVSLVQEPRLGPLFLDPRDF